MCSLGKPWSINKRLYMDYSHLSNYNQPSRMNAECFARATTTHIHIMTRILNIPGPLRKG